MVGATICSHPIKAEIGQNGEILERRLFQVIVIFYGSPNIACGPMSRETNISSSFIFQCKFKLAKFEILAIFRLV